MKAYVPGGAHRALTLAACLLAAKLLDADLTAAAAHSHDLVPAGRGNIRHKAGIEIIDDSYNFSMHAAVSAHAPEPCRVGATLCLEHARVGSGQRRSSSTFVNTVVNEPKLHGIVGRRGDGRSYRRWV